MTSSPERRDSSTFLVMIRRAFPSFLQLAGLALIVAAAFLVSVILGIFAAGVVVFGLGVLLEKPGDER